MVLKVFLWDATTAGREAVMDGHRAHVTDVAKNEWVPRPGGLLIALKIEDGDFQSTWAVTLLGRVKSKTAVATGRSRYLVEPLHVLDPFPLDDLVDELSNDAQSQISAAGFPTDSRPVPLPPQAAKEIVAALMRRPGVSEWFKVFEDVPWHEIVPSKRDAILEGSDALQTAVQASGLGDALSEMRNPKPDIDKDELLSVLVQKSHLVDTEDALIQVDLHRLAADTAVRNDFAAQAAVLTGVDYELVVLNVNRQPLEKALGVDLIYWDTIHDTATMLQYKRLDKKPPSSEWRFSREAEIKEQLALMQPYTLSANEAAHSKNWRMTSPYWFKFAHRDAASEGGKLLLRGMYVPADYLRVAIDDGSLRKTTPQGGFHITYDNTAYITRDTFTELLTRGFIGTAGAQSADVEELLRISVEEDRNVVVAVKTKKEKWVASTARRDGDEMVNISFSEPWRSGAGTDDDRVGSLDAPLDELSGY